MERCQVIAVAVLVDLRLAVAAGDRVADRILQAGRFHGLRLVDRLTDRNAYWFPTEVLARTSGTPKARPAAETTRFETGSIVKGVKRNGRAKLNGWVGPGATDSASRVVLEAVDLVPLQPYLLKKNEARVARGTLDLNLASEVRNNNFD